jgi:hypothetical protein
MPRSADNGLPACDGGRLHFFLDDLARHRRRLLAILGQQALDQPGAL